MLNFTSRQLDYLCLEWKEIQTLKKLSTAIAVRTVDPIVHKDLFIPTAYVITLSIKSFIKTILESRSKIILNNQFNIKISFLENYPNVGPILALYPAPFNPHFEEKKSYGVWKDYQKYNSSERLGSILIRLINALKFEPNYIRVDSKEIGNKQALLWYLKQKNDTPKIFPTDNVILPSIDQFSKFNKNAATCVLVGEHDKPSPTAKGKKEGENMKTKRILFLAANPIGTDKLRVDEELRRIDEGLQAAKLRSKLELVSKWAVTIETITKAMLDYDPQIIHFSGHGEKNGIAIENNDGKSHIISPKALTKLFKLFKDKIECVMLNACYTEEQAKIISANNIYVIGMSDAINDRDAIDFSVGFYQSIGAGKDYTFAYQMGQTLIMTKNSSQYEIPTIWKNGKLLSFDD